MDLFRGLEHVAPPTGGSVLTVGNFDGVHRGHARIVARAQDVAQEIGAQPIAMTFDPHPLEVLAPERAPARLTTTTEKLALLARLGLKACVVVPVDQAFLGLEAEDFLARLVTRVRPRAFVEGPDFRFGRGRAGSNDTLRAHAQDWGYAVHVVPAFHAADLPTHPTISSSSIRQALRDGRVEEANAMLGRPYRVVGVTGTGEGRGAALGFPTANLDGVDHLLPQEAVYAALAQLPDGTLRPAAVNIGPQPTFDQQTVRVEAHVLDLADSLRGQRLGLHFLARLRAQQKFESPDALVAQLKRDVQATRARASGFAAVEPIPL